MIFEIKIYCKITKTLTLLNYIYYQKKVIIKITSPYMWCLRFQSQRAKNHRHKRASYLVGLLPLQTKLNSVMFFKN
jgi:hypothetical protein